MKILMRNIGMTLHVIHKLRAEGIDNVKVEHGLAAPAHERREPRRVRGAARGRGAPRAPARELRLGHVRRRQHGRRDGVHGDARARGRAAPRRLRRRTASGSASTSTRTPRTRSRPCGEACCSGGSSTPSPRRSTTPRCARRRCARTPCAPTSSCTQRSARDGSTRRPRRRNDRRQGARDHAVDGDVVASAEEGYPLSHASTPTGRSRIPTTGGDASERALPRSAPRRRRVCVGLSGQMHGLVCLDDRDRVASARRSCGTTSAPVSECAEIEDRVGLERLDLRSPATARFPGFTAPKPSWLRRHEPDVYARIRRIVLPKDYVRLRLTGDLGHRRGGRVRHASFDVANRSWSDEVLDALGATARVAPARPRVHRDRRCVATSNRRHSAWSRSSQERSPSSSGRRGVVLAPSRPYAHDANRRASTPSVHALPGHLGGDGRDAERGRRHCGGCATTLAPDATLVRRSRRRRAGSEPGADGLTFLPYLQGERTPHADPDARAPSRASLATTVAARSSVLCSKVRRSTALTR